MINRKVTGIGCFAKPATLSRVFKKMVRNYTLGQFESINLANSQDMAGGARWYDNAESTDRRKRRIFPGAGF